jgi:hypothetical protein
MKWPRGRINKHRIGGFRIRFAFNVLFWSWRSYWRFGEIAIHLGPVHVWLDLEYEW